MKNSIILEKNYRDLILATAELVATAGQSPTIVLAEDKITLAIERAIVQKCGGTFFTNVTTLNRFYNKFVKDKKSCSKMSSVLIIKKLLDDNLENLRCFKGGVSLAFSLFELISQLKSAKVSYDRLSSCEKDFQGMFAHKLHDVSLIYSLYEKYLEENDLTDLHNRLEGFEERLKDFPFEDYDVIISGYQSVTGQTAQVYSYIQKRAKSTTFVCLAGSSDVYTNEMFNFAKKFNFEEKVSTKEGERYDLADGLYRENITPHPSDKVSITAYTDEMKELCVIAENIKKRVIEGAKYRDFTLVAGNFSSVKFLIKKVFADYELPIYLEDSFNLSTHPIIKGLGLFLKLIGTKFTLQNFKSFIRFSVFFSDRDFTDKFISYVEKNAYTEKTIKNGFTGEDVEIKEFRERVLKLLEPSVTNTASEYVKRIESLLADCNVVENLKIVAQTLSDGGEKELGKFCESGLEKILELLQEVKIILGNEKISVKDLYKVIYSGALACQISVIPQSNDCVYVGNFENCKFRSCKHLYVSGLTSNIPYGIGDTAIFNNADLKRLDKLSVVIDPKIEIVNKRKREDVCLGLMGFTDSLNLSYACADVVGNAQVKSEIISDIEKIFNVTEKEYAKIEKELLYCEDSEQRARFIANKYLTYPIGFKNFAIGMSEFKYTDTFDTDYASFYQVLKDTPYQSWADNLTSLINAELKVLSKNSGELFFNDKFVSVSAVESYFSCPYLCFAQNGLKLAQDEVGDMNTAQFGNFIHSILEGFVIELKKDYITTEEDVILIVNQLIDALLSQPEYSIYLKKFRQAKFMGLVREECLSACIRVFKDFKKSNYKPEHTEYTFGFSDSECPPLKLNTKNGVYNIRGKIDRVDTCGKFVRIIDYKSGKTEDNSIDFDDERWLYLGKKIQLYLYMNVFLNQGYRPGGAYYSKISGDYKTLDDKTITLQGKTVNSEENIVNTDTEILDNKTSTIVDVKLNSKGYSSKKLIEEQDLLNLCEYAKLITSKATEDIKRGTILPSPLKDGCKYCKFKGLCGYDREARPMDRQCKQVGKSLIGEIVASVENVVIQEDENSGKKTKKGVKDDGENA